MTKTDITITAALLAAGATFFFFDGFWSGFISGSCLSIAILATIGKVIAGRAARQIDRNIKQRLQYSEQDHENYDV